MKNKTPKNPDGLLRTIDGADFTEHHMISRLIGIDPIYKGFTQREGLFEELAKAPWACVTVRNIHLMHPQIIKAVFNEEANGKLSLKTMVQLAKETEFVFLNHVDTKFEETPPPQRPKEPGR